MGSLQHPLRILWPASPRDEVTVVNCRLHLYHLWTAAVAMKGALSGTKSVNVSQWLAHNRFFVKEIRSG